MGVVKDMLTGAGVARTLGVKELDAQNVIKGDTFLPSLRDTADPGGFFHARNSPLYQYDPLNKGSFSDDAARTPIIPPNPNAPGSIFNMQGQRGPAPNLPPPGYATNGLQVGGSTNGLPPTQSPDWAAIIAHALRK